MPAWSEEPAAAIHQGAVFDAKGASSPQKVQAYFKRQIRAVSGQVSSHRDPGIAH